jgi:hypothetical protein
MHDHVASLDQSVERGAIVRTREIERDAALVGVQIEIESAGLRIRPGGRKRSPLPRAVAVGKLSALAAGAELMRARVG